MGETLTFTSRLRRRDHLWYFARHFFPDLWMPWLVAFGVAAAFAVFNLLGGMPWLDCLLRFAVLGAVIYVLMFALAGLLFGLRLRQFSADGVVLAEKEVHVDGDALTITYDGGSAVHAWTRIEWIRERGRFLFLKLRGDEVLLLFRRRDLPPGATDVMRTHLAATGEAA